MAKKGIAKRKRKLFIRYGPFCQGCGKQFPFELLTVDHIRPKSKGGHRYAFYNLQLMCQPCNNAKADSWDGVSGVGSDNPNERNSHTCSGAMTERKLLVWDSASSS